MSYEFPNGKAFILEVENVKDRILDAARERFRTVGFSRVTVDDLTKELAISKKTFYKVFASKDALVEQIMHRAMGELRINLDSIVAGQYSFVKKLHEVLGFLAAFMNRIGFAFVADVQRCMPHLWKELENFRAQRVMDIFGQLINQGMREGFVRADLNKGIFLAAYLASIQHIIQPARLANESFSAHEAIREILSIFFKGAMTDQGRRDFNNLQNEHVL